MRLIKLGLLSTIALFLVTCFVFMLFPSHIRISRVINIISSKEVILHRVGDFRTWVHWNEFFRQASLAHTVVSSPSSGRNAFFVSDPVRVNITRIIGDSIITAWQQRGHRPYTGVFFVYQGQPGNSTVQWYFDFNIKWWPWEKLRSMYYDKEIGPGMEKSLINLKKMIENNQ